MKEVSADLGLLWLRLLMGAGIAYHGYGKVFGGHIVKLTEGVAQMGFPSPELFAWMAALSEFVGGILIVAGVLTRFAALAVFMTMCVAIFVAHANDPLGVKELATAYLTMAGTLMLTGPGSISLGRFVGKGVS
ncbi:MAG TPA: DoxX family protein [Candidatus Omnitrophota bacterium]|nr:DoxX family protein [Candidatus Omnitrophota bacterium]